VVSMLRGGGKGHGPCSGLFEDAVFFIFWCISATCSKTDQCTTSPGGCKKSRYLFFFTLFSRLAELIAAISNARINKLNFS
jgi:hypothetical protein